MPVRQGDGERLHVHLADVASHPVLEDIDKGAAPSSGGEGVPLGAGVRHDTTADGGGD
jgi:hypothetical protein